MMFDPRNGAALRQRKLLVAALVVGWGTSAATVVYIAAHFIMKFW